MDELDYELDELLQEETYKLSFLETRDADRLMQYALDSMKCNDMLDANIFASLAIWVKLKNDS